MRTAAILAVRMEREHAGHVYLDVPGGKVFDRLVKKEREEW